MPLLCPGCGHRFLVMFVCDDGKYRCVKCRADQPVRLPAAPAIPARHPGSHGGAHYPQNRGRIQCLRAIEAEIQARIQQLKTEPADALTLAKITACEDCIRIVRDYHVIRADGTPLRIAD